MKKRTKLLRRLGERIGAALSELEAALRSDRPLREQFTVHVVKSRKNNHIHASAKKSLFHLRERGGKAT